MFVLEVATSIDALAVGVSFSMMRVEVIPAVAILGIIMFIVLFFGLMFGNFAGSKFQSKAELFGGIVLIVIDAKVLLEGLQII